MNILGARNLPTPLYRLKSVIFPLLVTHITDFTLSAAVCAAKDHRLLAKVVPGYTRSFSLWTPMVAGLLKLPSFLLFPGGYCLGFSQPRLRAHGKIPGILTGRLLLCTLSISTVIQP